MGYGIFGSGYVTKYGVPVIDCVGVVDGIGLKATPFKVAIAKKPYTLAGFANAVDFIFRNKVKGTFGVKMKNGDIVTAKLSDNDTWDDEKALLVCFAKYIGGGSLRDFFGLLDGVVDTNK